MKHLNRCLEIIGIAHSDVSCLDITRICVKLTKQQNKMEQTALAKLSAIIPQISAVPGLGHLPEAAVIAAHQQVPLTSIRYNPGKPVISHAALPSVPWSSYGVYL